MASGKASVFIYGYFMEQIVEGVERSISKKKNTALR